MDKPKSAPPPDIIECLLFAAGHPVSLREIAEILEIPVQEAQTYVNELMDFHDGKGGLRIVPVAKGYQMVTKPEFASYVARLRAPRKVRLSRAALESLAIVAYRQPITHPEIAHVRGVDSSGALKTLMERNLIASPGRKKAPGRPRLYATTPAFLDHFGLRDLVDLPELEDEELVQRSEALFREVAQALAGEARQTEEATTDKGPRDEAREPADDVAGAS